MVFPRGGQPSTGLKPGLQNVRRMLKHPERRLKFLCEEMLKRLGQWLRVAGYDVLMLPDRTCNDLFGPSARRAGPDIDNEHPFQALRPSHRGAGYPSVRYWRASKR